jgi:hypothetical protein
MVQGCNQRMPWQGRTFDTHGELTHAAKDGELVQFSELSGCSDLIRSSQPGMEPFEHGANLGLGLAPDRLGHQRSRGHRDRAAGALKSRVGNFVIRDCEGHRQLVTAERIVAKGAIRA